MATINFRLKSKAKKNVSIYVYFRSPNTSQVIESRTGYTVHSDYWSSKKKQILAKTPELKNLNQTLVQLESFLHTKLNDEMQSGIEFDRTWLKTKVEEFNNVVPVTDLSVVINFVEHEIGNLSLKKANDGSTGLRASTIKGYKSFLGVLSEYEDYFGQKLRFSALSAETIDNYKNWLLKTKQYSNSYVSRNLKNLKSILKKALVSGQSVKVNPDYIDTRFNFKTKKVINIITEEEFQRIAELKDLDKILENSKKWFLIGLKTGQRVSDLLEMQKKDIIFDDEKNTVLIEFHQIKTGVKVRVPIVNEEVLNILGSELPYKIPSQKFNIHIKELCRLAEIEEEVEGYWFNPKTKRRELAVKPKYELIASHDMRRSFATNSFEKGIPPSFIMNMTGHKRESNFFEYIGKSPDLNSNAYNFLNALNENTRRDN